MARRKNDAWERLLELEALNKAPRLEGHRTAEQREDTHKEIVKALPPHLRPHLRRRGRR